MKDPFATVHDHEERLSVETLSGLSVAVAAQSAVRFGEKL